MPSNSATPVEPLYPIFLRLSGRKVVLVGGGVVAASKYQGLRAADAQVTVVAPEIGPTLREPGTTLLNRPFEPGDLEGAWFVVAAAPPEVNRAVLAAAEPRGLFVNAVDDVGAASAYAGAVVRRGVVTLAISTGGRAPALAGLLREGLDAMLPEDLGSWAELAHGERAAWKEAGVPLGERRLRLLAAINRLYAPQAAEPAS